MRRLILVTLVIAAPLLAIGATPASACGWYGYRGCGCYPPRAYGYSCYRPTCFYRSYYRPAFAYAGFYRQRVWGWGGLGLAWMATLVAAGCALRVATNRLSLGIYLMRMLRTLAVLSLVVAGSPVFAQDKSGPQLDSVDASVLAPVQKTEFRRERRTGQRIGGIEKLLPFFQVAFGYPLAELRVRHARLCADEIKLAKECDRLSEAIAFPWRSSQTM